MGKTRPLVSKSDIEERTQGVNDEWQKKTSGILEKKNILNNNNDKKVVSAPKKMLKSASSDSIRTR